MHTLSSLTARVKAAEQAARRAKDTAGEEEAQRKRKEEETRKTREKAAEDEVQRIDSALTVSI